MSVSQARAHSFTGSCICQQFRTFCFTGMIFLPWFPIRPSSFSLWPIFTLFFRARRKRALGCSGPEKGEVKCKAEKKIQSNRGVSANLQKWFSNAHVQKPQKTWISFRDFLERRKCNTEAHNNKRHNEMLHINKISSLPVYVNSFLLLSCAVSTFCNSSCSFDPPGYPLFIFCYVKVLPTLLKYDRARLVLALGSCDYIFFIIKVKPQHICWALAKCSG